MKQLIIISLLIVFSRNTYAQNEGPSIPVSGTETIEITRTVRIVYDLFDKENDKIKVTLKVSNNGGKDFLFNVGSPTGDIGYPVLPGENKEIIWNYPDTVSYNDIISGRFLIKLVADDLQEFDIQGIVDLVDSVNLKKDLGFVQGARHYNPPHNQHLEAVKEMIESRFGSLGLGIEKDVFSYDTYQAENIIGKLYGHYNEQDYYIICGHFDSVEWGPGADDNGSAVVGFLEAARVLSKFNFEKTIRFVGFDLEEQRITGSNHYVNNALPANTNLEGVFNFEMIGYYKETPNSQEIPSGFETLFPDFYQSVVDQSYRGNFIFNVANTSSNGLKTSFDQAAAEFVPDLRVLSLAVAGNGDVAPDLRRSDHSRFWDAGYKALMLSDGANFRNKNYHTEYDLLDSLDFRFMEKVVKATIATVAKLAKPIHSAVKVFHVKQYSVYDQPISLDENHLDVKVWPNPANGNVTFKFDLLEAGDLKINIYDTQGKLVRKVFQGEIIKGSHEIEFEAQDLDNGLYLYKFIFKNNYLKAGKLLLTND